METAKAYTGITFTLEQATKAQRGNSGIALLFLQPRHKMGVGGQRHAPATLPSRKGTVTHHTEGWVSPRASLDGCGKSRSLWDYPPPTSL